MPAKLHRARPRFDHAHLAAAIVGDLALHVQRSLRLAGIVIHVEHNVAVRICGSARGERSGILHAIRSAAAATAEDPGDVVRKIRFEHAAVTPEP